MDNKKEMSYEELQEFNYKMDFSIAIDNSKNHPMADVLTNSKFYNGFANLGVYCIVYCYDDSNMYQVTIDRKFVGEIDNTPIIPVQVIGDVKPYSLKSLDDIKLLVQSIAKNAIADELYASNFENHYEYVNIEEIRNDLFKVVNELGLEDFESFLYEYQDDDEIEEEDAYDPDHEYVDPFPEIPLDGTYKGPYIIPSQQYQEKYKALYNEFVNGHDHVSERYFNGTEEDKAKAELWWEINCERLGLETHGLSTDINIYGLDK